MINEASSPGASLEQGCRPELPKVGRTLQDYADEILAPEFRQPLMTARHACWANGWAFDERPVCCGKECERHGFIGGAYHVECESCGRFIADVTGPSFSNGGGCVYLIDTEKFPADTDWSVCWIAGRTLKTKVGTPSSETPSR